MYKLLPRESFYHHSICNITLAKCFILLGTWKCREFRNPCQKCIHINRLGNYVTDNTYLSPLFLSLSLYIYIYIYLCLFLSISLSLSLSLTLLFFFLSLSFSVTLSLLIVIFFVSLLYICNLPIDQKLAR